MIDFNDACRYQNYLKNLLCSAVYYLRDDDFVTTTVETHHKSDANKNESDEVKTVQGPFDDINITPAKMIDLVLDILDEREQLAEAIAEAKAQADLQIDAACMSNKDKAEVVSYLTRLTRYTTSEYENVATAYVFNEIDGKQTPYVYKVNTVKKINFDRNVVKGILGRLKREMTDTSKKIDRFNLDIQVDFEPRWSEEDSVEDIISAS